MTTGVGDRRWRSVSLSLPDASGAPVDQLSRAVDIFHRVIRTLPTTVIDREELIALGGFLTHVSDALLTLTDQLNASANHFDRIQCHRATGEVAPADRLPTASQLLQGCRDGFLAAYTSAQALHADLRRCPTGQSTLRRRRLEQ